MSAWLRRLWAIGWAEGLYLRRDRTSLALLVLIPVVQLLLFGFAVRTVVQDVPVAVAAPAGPICAAALRALPRPQLRVISGCLPPGGAERLLRIGSVRLALEVSNSASAPDVRLLLDGSDPAVVRPALAALQQGLLTNASGLGVQLKTVWLYNPDQRTDWVLAPGLAGVVMMISMLMLGAQALVRERETGAWESLLVTPAGRAELLLGKAAPYILVGTLQCGLTLLLGRLAFGLPMNGAWMALLALAPLFAAAHLALGFALSALAATRLQAIQGAVFFYLPSLLLSGFLFPFEAMPAWARSLGEVLPLTAFVRAARLAVLRGGDAAQIWAQAPSMVAVTLAGGLVTALFYRARL